jgi:hypothetical protein
MFTQHALGNSLLGGLFQPPQVFPFGNVWGSDGIDTRYNFTIYDISARPAGVNAVYMFARQSGETYIPLYIGRAEILSERLANHEKRLPAIVLGASRLLIHIPGPQDRIRYQEAERRLIHRFSPMLNVQHNHLSRTA